MTKLFLLAAVVLLNTTALAQPVSYTPAQIERVAKLSELYGHIKFFHPYLGYKPINWDSAFAATAPLVANAKTDDQTVTAIRQLLSVLGDDATTVQLKAKPTTASTTTTDSIQVYLRPDSVLVLKTNQYAGVADFEMTIEKLSMLAFDLLPKARAVLLDLRSGRALSELETESFRYGLSYVGLERSLATKPVVTAGNRLRTHSGFVAEGGSSANGYWSGFYTLSGQTVLPRKSAKDRPLVILVNKNAVLPPALFALRTCPHVQFYSTEPLSDAQLARTITFPFSDRINVQFRTGELINPDGSLGVTGVSLIPTPAKSPEGPVEAAEAFVLDQLRKSHQTTAATVATTPATLPVTPPPPVYPPAKYPSPGYRLLAGAKIWSVIHYFHA